MSQRYRVPVRVGSLLLALGACCVAPGIGYAQSRVPTHVACVGDSITFGSGASTPDKSYPSVMQALFGAQVKVGNYGHSGATLLSAPYGDTPYVAQTEYQGATTFVSGAGANAIVDVVILLGTNDSKPFNWAPSGKPKNDQQYLNDYRAMVAHFAALTPTPQIYLGLPLATGNNPCCSIDGTVIHDEVLPLIKQLAQEKHLPIIDLNTPTTGHPEYFGDGVHPKDAAYAIVAKLVHDGLLAPLGNGGSGGGGAGGVGAAGAAGNAGTAGSSDTGTAGVGSSGTGAGGASAGNAGSAGTSSGGASAGGAPSAGASPGGTSAGGAANNASGASSSPAASDPSGCGVARAPNARSPIATALLLALSLLALRRRRARDVLQPANPHAQ